MLFDEGIGPGELQLLGVEEVLQHVRPGLHHQDIALADVAQAQVTEQLGRPADDADHLQPAVGQRFEAVNLLVDQRVVLGDEDFGDVVLDLELGLIALRRAAVLRDQPPADQQQEHQPGEGQHPADGGEGEQAEGLARDLLPVVGDDDVRRRPDKRGQPAEDGPERQRHQHLTGPLGQGQRHRHQQRQRADVVHEAREQRGDPGQRRHERQRPVGQALQRPGEAVDDAAVLQRPGQHQHQRHGDDRALREAHEGIVGLDHADEHGRDQRGQRDHVVAQPPPDEGNHGEAEDREDQGLINAEQGGVGLHADVLPGLGA